MTRAEKLGTLFADGVMEAAHQLYNAPRSRQMVLTCIKHLQKRVDELQPKKADPTYKKARYG